MNTRMIFENIREYITLKKLIDVFTNIMLGIMEMPYLSCIFAIYLEIIYISYD